MFGVFKTDLTVTGYITCYTSVLVICSIRIPEPVILICSLQFNFTNVTAAEHIVRAVKAQPDPDAVRVVYIGTVAETGDRSIPVHWAAPAIPSRSVSTTTTPSAR